MPVSGLVVTLIPPRDSAETPDTPDIHADTPDAGSPLDDEGIRVIEQINKHPHLQTGPLQGRRLPVVADTPDREADKQCWGWLNELTGVHHVDVAFIHFEDEDALDHAACPPSQMHADQVIPAPTIGET